MPLKNGAEDHRLTDEDRRKGAEKSHEARRRNKSIKECLVALLNGEITAKDGTVKTGAEAIALKAFQEALKGNPKFWELVRDSSGQKPVEKVAVADITTEQLDEVHRLLSDAKNEG